jgi:hypothetical protein
MTNTSQRLLIQKALKIEIIELLEWEELQWCSFQFEQGLRYLDSYVGRDAHNLLQKEIFWTWWKDQWALRDEDLMIRGLAELPVEDRVGIYTELHDGMALTSLVHPHRTVMEQSYAEMINQLILEELSKATS